MLNKEKKLGDDVENNTGACALLLPYVVVDVDNCELECAVTISTPAVTNGSTFILNDDDDSCIRR